MTHAARLRDSAVKLGRLGSRNLVAGAVAGIARRSASVSFLEFLAMHAARMIASLVDVAGGAGWLGDASRVRILFMLQVALCATHLRVSRFTHLRGGIVTAGAGGAGVFRRRLLSERLRRPA